MTTWLIVTRSPLRIEHPTFGAVQDEPGATVRVEPRCGHGYAVLAVVHGREQLEERGGLCLRCWVSARKTAG